MLGTITVLVRSERINYELHFNHLISLIIGDSGSGKSVLMEIIRRHEGNISISGVSEYFIFTQDLEWELVEMQFRLIQSRGGGVIFADEDVDLIRYHEFYKLLQKYNLRAVICLRDLRSMGFLSYSWAALYKLYYDAQSNTNKLMHYFSNSIAFSRYMGLKVVPFAPERVSVEDKGYGLHFYRYAFGDKCTSMEGKGNVKSVIVNSVPHERLLLIMDGADIGSELYKIKVKLEEPEHDGIVIWLPECTEWVLLLLPKLYDEEVNISGSKVRVLEVLKSPAILVDTSKWYSYERFYADILRQVCENNGFMKDLKSYNAIPESFIGEKEVEYLLSWLDGLDLSKFGITERHVPPQLLSKQPETL